MIGRQRFATKVLRRRDSLSAREVLEFYFLKGGPLHPSLGHYFIRRFGQPRHLAALSLATALPSKSKPVLDIACGMGHLAHYLTVRGDPAQVVGLDMNFYHLWIARHWLAPAGRFICANVGDGLPFADGTFSATVCSDAYHLLPNRRALLEEARRCSPDGMTVLTRVGNSAVMPNEGRECTLAGYLQEFGTPCTHAFDEDELVDHYLRGTDPLDTPSGFRRQLDAAKWLSFVWAPRDQRSRAQDATAPHAVGNIGFNPIYARKQSRDGGLQLQFEFPMPWYAYENHRMLAYHPRRVALTADDVASLSKPGSAKTRELIASFVLLGFPARFTNDFIRIEATD